MKWTASRNKSSRLKTTKNSVLRKPRLWLIPKTMKAFVVLCLLVCLVAIGKFRKAISCCFLVERERKRERESC